MSGPQIIANCEHHEEGEEEAERAARLPKAAVARIGCFNPGPSQK